MENGTFCFSKSRIDGVGTNHASYNTLMASSMGRSGGYGSHTPIGSKTSGQVRTRNHALIEPVMFLPTGGGRIGLISCERAIGHSPTVRIGHPIRAEHSRDGVVIERGTTGSPSPSHVAIENTTEGVGIWVITTTDESGE